MPRFAVPFHPAAQVPVDGLGMLVTPRFPGEGGDGLTQVASLASMGSLCLLGEPGAGKSTALRDVVMDIPTLENAEPGRDAAHFVALGEVAERAAFRELVAEPVLARVPSAGPGSGCLTLVLDGLDECPLPGGSKALAGLLARMFQKTDISALRVLVGCRTAEYPDAVDGLLTGTWPEFAQFELAPLSRRDVVELAASRGVAPEAFLDAVTSSGSGPLACLPLTLDLLLHQYEDAGGLHGPASRLYETALLRLAAEPDADRAASRRPTASSEQILAVAGRLCCHLLLCGRAAFWTDPAQPPPAGHLDPSGLAGGYERQPGGPFPVTAELVQTALYSALFTSRGPRRLGPAHATFASYLAARHLAAHNLPEVQLRSLLTVTTATGNTGIPARLRETASWLLALRPDTTSWLADVDPIGLVAHTDVINDPGTRELITERLLADPRAALAGRWQQRWHLAHPNLTEQLSPVLAALADPDAPQPPADLAHLALYLAGQAGPGAIVPLLLDIACRPDLGSPRRAMAARYAGRLDEDGAAVRLKEVLKEITAHPDHDPDDEIRGSVLEALWPGHLPVAGLVAALAEPQRHEMIGAYRGFRQRMPSLLPEEDIAFLLRWASGDPPPGTQAEGPMAGGGPRLKDTEMAGDLLDRVFGCQDLASVIGPAADFIAAFMQDYSKLEVPAALDERDAAGVETATSRANRRMLASALLTRNDDPDQAFQVIIWGWDVSPAAHARHAAALNDGKKDYPPGRRGLLDRTDLSWVLEKAAADSPGRAPVYVPLLRSLFDQDDPSAQEAAWAVRDTGLWPAFTARFDPIRRNGEEETRARDIFEADHAQVAGWAQAPAHRAQVLDLYERAAGDASAFMELLAALAVNPATGNSAPFREDNIARCPGIELLPPGWPDQLREAAWNYVHRTTPPGEDCLDHHETWSVTAETGYLALLLLARSAPAAKNLSSLTTSTLAAWAPAILSVPASAEDFDVKRPLLARLTHETPAILPGLISRFLLGHLSTSMWPNRLEALDAACTDAVGDVLTRHLSAVTDALRATIASPPSVEDPDRAATGSPPNGSGQQQQRRDALQRTLVILTRILAGWQHAGIQVTRSIITEAIASGADEASQRAGHACAAGLLTGDLARHLSVLSELEQAPGLLREVLQDLAHDQDSSLSGLTDEQLAELWELLARQWPYQNDVPWSSGYVTPVQQAQDWRDTVLMTLTRRGTSHSVRVLTRLAGSHSELLWLTDRIRDAEALEREYGWAPLHPEELTRLIEDSRSRLVRDDSDLADLVAAAITDAAATLTTTGQLLWDHYKVDGAERWRPKSELDVEAWLAEQLTRRLTDSGVVINRQVLVRQTRTQGLGLTVDLQADAAASPGQDTVLPRCRIELKGNWNKDLDSAMRTQLAEDYLLPFGLRDGIYVTAWFDTSLWNDPEDTDGYPRAARLDREITAQKLQEQAEHLRRRGLRIRSQVIDIPRPVPSTRSTHSRGAADQGIQPL